MPAGIPAFTRKRIIQLASEGMSQNQISINTGVHVNTVRNTLRKAQGSFGTKSYARQMERAELINRPFEAKELNENAQRGLVDFAFFRRHYLGHVTLPWHEQGQTKVEELLATPTEEYLVINIAPGIGKSTWVRDLGTWLTIKDRSRRNVYGSNIYTNAKQNIELIRRYLETPVPMRARKVELANGVAFDAEGVLAADYGLFKPTLREGIPWEASRFTVVQAEGEMVGEKEPTWSAVGEDTEFLGNRFDLIVWDDVVTDKSVNSIDSIQRQRHWWDQYAETRLDPGGLMVLVGQRWHPEDLYRYCLDKEITLLDDHDLEFEDPASLRTYHHISFRAHDETKCEGRHTDLPPWPDSCLLDPKRLFWRKLQQKQADSPRAYLISFQQEDMLPDEALVSPLWIKGGIDPTTNEVYPGCQDHDRTRGQWLDGVSSLNMVTVDPSPSRWWAVQTWQYIPKFHWHVLIDAIATKMGANELLDYDPVTQTYGGVLEQIADAARREGHPLTHVILETVAAQKFMLQYKFAQMWMAHQSIQFVSHTTGLNKLDKDYGVETIGPAFKYGQIRLPWADPDARRASERLVHEVTRYPSATTTDQMMAAWFETYNAPRLYREPEQEIIRQRVPSWVSGMPHLRRVM